MTKRPDGRPGGVGSVLGEDVVEAGRVDHTVGPGLLLSEIDAGKAVEDVLRERTEAAGELAEQQGAFASR